VEIGADVYYGIFLFIDGSCWSFYHDLFEEEMIYYILATILIIGLGIIGKKITEGDWE
jgi:predicted membrane channel-forming protein YqfA (hemolysin III family)